MNDEPTPRFKAPTPRFEAPAARLEATAPRFEVNTLGGWIAPARRVDSPNRDARPAGMPVDLIVVHGISLPPGEFDGPWIERLFTNTLPPDGHDYFAQVCDLRVSAHLLIRRSGEVVQFVGFDERAWHAGKSSYQGREACNDFSVGIELEGCDEVAYEPAQYRALAGCIAALCAAYPTLSAERVVGHNDIAPGRKTDPGPSFDWASLRNLMETPKRKRERHRKQR